MIPLDPGQALSVCTEGGRSIEITPLAEHLPRTIALGNRHQPVHHSVCAVLLLHGQHGAALRVVTEIAVAAIIARCQYLRQPMQVLPVELLIGLTDQRQAILAQAECAATILIDAAAQRPARWSQAAQAFRCPVPQPGAGILRIELGPQHATQPHA